MKKEIFNLKLELFKNTVTNYQISKKGNHWGYLGQKVLDKREYTVGLYNVTKNSINKMFQVQEYSRNNSTILMMTPKGKLFIKQPINKSFKAVTINSCQNIEKLFLFGRKSEWLANHPDLVRVKFLHSFKSLKELKLYLGYEFLSGTIFNSLLVNKHFLSCVIYSKLLTHNDRVNILYHKNNSFLIDAMDMAVQLNEPIVIPESKEKLKSWHDDLVAKKNMEKASNYDATELQYESWLFEHWNNRGIDFEVLNSPRKLFIQGCKQNHCLASYANKMTNNMYVTFKYNEADYDMQINNVRGKVQFCGYKNQSPPKELIDLCTFDNIGDYYFKIINPTNFKSVSQQELVEWF